MKSKGAKVAAAFLCVGVAVSGCGSQGGTEDSADVQAATDSIPSRATPAPQVVPPLSLQGSELALGSTEERSASVTLEESEVLINLTRIASTDQIQRAEAIWGDEQDPSEPLALTAGSTVTATFTTSLDLDGAAGTGIWAVVWQLIGPEASGSWPGPPLALTISNDSWLIGGGEGHPEGSRESYIDTGVPFADGRAVEWTIQVHLKRGGGAVNVWADGQQVVEGWSPPAGTMYPNQSFVIMKNGLYTGGNGGDGARTTMVVSDARAAVLPPTGVSPETSMSEGS